LFVCATIPGEYFQVMTISAVDHHGYILPCASSKAYSGKPGDADELKSPFIK
jgi:hypothetical protein